MAVVGGLLFAIVVWAALLWGAIRLLDPENEHNSFAAALLWSGINAVLALATANIYLFGIILLIGYCALMIMLLTRMYELDFFRALLVVAVVIVSPHFLMPPLARFVGASAMRAFLVLYGIPLGILGAWQWRRMRATTAVGDVPTARAVKARPPKRNRRAAKVAAPAPAPTPAPAADPRPEPERPADGGPTFLR